MPIVPDPIPTRNVLVALLPDILLTHQAGDCASDHDRDSAVHRLPLFPTRAIGVRVPVCALEALEQYRSHRLAATLNVGVS